MIKLSESIGKRTLIDKSIWKTFVVGNLFDVSRGKRIVRNRDYSDDKTIENIYPVITAKTTNNAIDGYYKDYNCEGNCITSGGEATGMISFYQSDKCWVMDRSRILKPKFKLNKYIASFIIPQLNNYSDMFGYDKSANPDDIKPLTISLPVDQYGNPDWEYMEAFTRERFSKTYSLSKISYFSISTILF